MKRFVLYQLSVMRIVMLRTPITSGHLTRLKVKTESQSQTFIK